ncbi:MULTISPECIES: hypothetical protein [Microbacterium]|uniref:Uncharacterized protein n=1 Tax=Microbacterium testaceum TaxID=2033 RepID=A0A147FBC7_MICTE|nr:hypothetical protein [Microbacterium testaceum]KTS04776.1 hypothetical protein NS283_08230 [Microbacterium testaceum]KTS13796.1 hypothetical protein RSA3_03030 [Microbacterium testaceum]
MRQPKQPPVTRTTAQLVIIVGSMILFVGLVFLTIFLALGDPTVTSARGVPLWLSTSVLLVIGSAVITVGVVMYPRGRSGTPPT